MNLVVYGVFALTKGLRYGRAYCICYIATWNGPKKIILMFYYYFYLFFAQVFRQSRWFLNAGNKPIVGLSTLLRPIERVYLGNWKFVCGNWPRSFISESCDQWSSKRVAGTCITCCTVWTNHVESFGISAICRRHPMSWLTKYLFFLFSQLAGKKKPDILLAVRCQNRSTSVL